MMSDAKSKTIDKLPMVGWYDPVQLAKTGAQVAVSTIFGQRADFRIVEALTPAIQAYFNYSSGETMGIDYVADVGDGWNPTYAVAQLLAEPSLTVDGEPLPRGQVLVMGGDEVYPTPSRDAYAARLVTPYRCAFANVEQPPDLYALPGNHDWYDGLSSFMRLFCQGRTLGALPTRQTRSYFALRLPKNWWIVGVDVQLESDIDGAQLTYFRSLADQYLDHRQKIILCTPEPDWIFGNIYKSSFQSNLAFLETEVLESRGARVRVRIAGDLHHYRRHESKPPEGAKLLPVHNITAGGGGAFLHPTHPQRKEMQTLKSGANDREILYEQKKSYPERSTSFWLTLRNIGFFWFNPTFGLLTGGLYALLTLGVATPTESGTPSFGEALLSLLSHPPAVILALVIVGAFLLFTDTHKLWYRLAAGGLHGFGHVLGAVALAWKANAWATDLGLGPSSSLLRHAFVGLTTLVGGYFVGATLMGLYLILSLNLFGRHGNEAFSSLRIDGYKNFLRMRIDKEGTLRIVAIGIERVPGSWREEPAKDTRSDGEPSVHVVPADGEKVECFKIEEIQVAG